MIMKIIKKPLRFLLNFFMRTFNYDSKVALLALDVSYALGRIANRGLEVNTIVDVGASDGAWSIGAKKIWPKSKCLLVEANSFHKSKLDKLTQATDGYDYILAAASSQDGEIFFDDSDPFGGVAGNSENISPDSIRKIKSISLDAEVARRGLAGPFLLKLDTHGYEIPILNGATKLLESSNLIVIEAYNFHLCKGSVTFDELCAFMRKKGFSVVDLAAPLWRPKDNVFWQLDLLFIRSTSSEFTSNAYE
jgi:FkbM family methyltransferase